MGKKSYKFNLSNLVATDGFQFSGSSLVNDILRSSGYVVPKNIRIDDELSNVRNNLSWPRAYAGEYTFTERLRLLFRILIIIFRRIPINIIQKTFIYEKYLNYKGRGVKLHEPTSVNRSIWSYFVNAYIVCSTNNFNEIAFVKWLGLKFKWQTSINKNLLLDNGIPKDKKIAGWFFRIKNTTGIYVFRNTRIQYLQICGFYNVTGKIAPNYEMFLCELEAQYEAMIWILDTDYKILMVSFDRLLNEISYRNKLEKYLVQEKVIQQMKYDFSKSIENNEALQASSQSLLVSELALQKEKKIQSYHDFFEKQLNEFVRS